ncbi:MAG: hypothetical protein VYD19_10405, partial [Myxococcota bacterium]|nr:hypothetical protein [Myxococcota bacterium]
MTALEPEGACSPYLLIFESDSAQRALLVEALRSLRHYRIFEVSNQQRAQTVLREKPIDWLLLGATTDIELSQALRESCAALQGVIDLAQEKRPSLSVQLSLPTHWTPLPTRELQSFTDSLIQTLQGNPQGAEEEVPDTPQRTASFTPIPDEGEAEEDEHARPPILWVGPTRPVAEALQRACEAQGFSLFTVEDAQAALRATREREFEAAYVFSALPDMNSLSLVRSLRRESGVGLPIAYIDQSEAVEDRIEAVHAGVSLFLHERAGQELLSQSVSQLQGLSDYGSQRILIVDDDQGV